MGFFDDIKDKITGDDDRNRQSNVQPYQGGYQQGYQQQGYSGPGGYQSQGYQQPGGYQQGGPGGYQGYQSQHAQQPYQSQHSQHGGPHGGPHDGKHGEQKDKGWSTGAKVAAGVLGAAAVVGVGAWGVHVSCA